jgi:hypothetical protein
MVVATFIFQGKGVGPQVDESATLARQVSPEDYTVDKLIEWVGEAMHAGLRDPKIARVEVGEPGQTPQGVFHSVRDFRAWRGAAASRTAA